MPHRLRNDWLEVIVDLPNENYRFSRFDWSGKIASVKFKGIPFTTNEAKVNPNFSNQGRGLYNEFDIQGPSDFDTTEIGSDFNKIGVGRLKKIDSQYDFFYPYSIEPALFEHQSDPQKIKITCTSPSYLLTKHISLRGNELIIAYDLRNSGIEAIETSEYTHNFLCIANDPMGSNYRLEFPFQIELELFDETVNPQGHVAFEDRSVSLLSKPQEAFFFSNLSGGKQVKAQWSLFHEPSNSSVTESTSFYTKQINLWGMDHVISPELFHTVHIGPKQSAHWTRTYTFN